MRSIAAIKEDIAGLKSGMVDEESKEMLGPFLKELEQELKEASKPEAPPAPAPTESKPQHKESVEIKSAYPKGKELYDKSRHKIEITKVEEDDGVIWYSLSKRKNRIKEEDLLKKIKEGKFYDQKPTATKAKKSNNKQKSTKDEVDATYSPDLSWREKVGEEWLKDADEVIIVEKFKRRVVSSKTEVDIKHTANPGDTILFNSKGYPTHVLTPNTADAYLKKGTFSDLYVTKATHDKVKAELAEYKEKAKDKERKAASNESKPTAQPKPTAASKPKSKSSNRKKSKGNDFVDDFRAYLANNIKSHSSDANYTQRELGLEVIGISESAISRAINTGGFSLKKALSIIYRLRIPPTELLDYEKIDELIASSKN